ncbi:MAG TPA: hypothetical protein VMY42_23360 [Thermoguttaceae bacterium]|nr:hypothetical protein [Thermoguttaceae bacterium]
MMINRFFILCVLTVAGAASDTIGFPDQDLQPADERITERITERIERLIEQLGDEDYFVRQRAETELSQFSYRAFDALDRATRHEDLEIATRAKALLESMRVEWTAADDSPEVRMLLGDYEEQNMPGKLTRMRSLAVLPDGAGIPALCRLARYEKSPLMSRHAAVEVLDHVPSDNPPEGPWVEKMRDELAGSPRPAALWLSTWLKSAEEPQSAIGEWTALVEDEYARLKESRDRTSSTIVARLVRLQIGWLQQLGRKDEVVAAVRRLIDLHEGSPKTLAELLDWLMRQQAWEATDDLVARCAEQFSSNPTLLYDLAQAQVEHGQPQRAEQTASQAFALNPENDTQQLARHLLAARTLRSRGLADWARREFRHVLDTGAEDDTIVMAALTEWLDWLVAQKAWQEVDELAAKFAQRFADEPVLLYTQAQALAEQGDLPAAEETAQRALKLNAGAEPAELNKHGAVAQALRARGLLKWAVAEYRYVIRTAEEENPVVAAAIGELLDWLVGQEAWTELDGLAAELAERFPDNAMLLYALAHAQTELGRKAQADQTAEKALGLYPGKEPADVNRHLLTAEALRTRRWFHWAAREYRHVIDCGSDHWEVLAELLECLLAQEAWKEIDELAGEFPMRFAGNSLLLYAQAQARAELGDEKAAEETAARARRLDPGEDRDSVNRHRLLAGTLRDRGRFDWAKQEYRQVIESDSPDFVLRMAAQSSLCEMLHDQGDDLQAAGVAGELVKTIESSPDAADLIRLRASAIRARADYFFSCHWEDKNDAAKRREYLDKAIEADPGDLDVLIACFGLPDRTAEYREKIVRLIKDETVSLRRQIAEEPASATAYNQFAWLAGNTGGDLEEALRYSKRSIELQPTYGGYYDTLAHVYFARGDYENAVKTQTKAAELEPHSGLIRKKLELFRNKREEEKKPKD